MQCSSFKGCVQTKRRHRVHLQAPEGLLRLQAHAEFSDEEQHQTARMIVAALLARIHTVEWTPALLNNKVLNISMHNNWCGRSGQRRVDAWARPASRAVELC